MKYTSLKDVPLSKERCPVCKTAYLYKEMVFNKLSRKDNATYICNDCGTNEAFSDFAKMELRK